MSNPAVLNSHRSHYVIVISECDCPQCVHNSSWHAHSYDVTISKVDIPLFDRMKTMHIITVNRTKFWCLLQQDVSNHVSHHMLCFYTYLTWQCPTCFATCCYDKHQNLIMLTVIINPLTPNDHYSGHTAPLTSKRYILYIYSTNIGTEYFKHGIYSPFFS